LAQRRTYSNGGTIGGFAWLGIDIKSTEKIFGMLWSAIDGRLSPEELDGKGVGEGAACVVRSVIQFLAGFNETKTRGAYQESTNEMTLYSHF
jgi:hypothetical protein